MGLFFALAGLGMLEPLLPSDLVNVKDIGLNGWVWDLPSQFVFCPESVVGWLLLYNP